MINEIDNKAIEPYQKLVHETLASINLAYRGPNYELVRSFQRRLGIGPIRKASEVAIGGSQVLDPSDFRDTAILAIPGLADREVLAIASAVVIRSYPSSRRAIREPELFQDRLTIATVIPVPFGDSSGLLVDSVGRLYTDRFMVQVATKNKPEFRFTQTTKPVPIDGFLPMYDTSRDVEIYGGLLPANTELFKITEDKWRTREILEMNGIKMPDAVLLTKESGEIEKQISAFAGQYGQHGFVVKGINGSGGINVLMFTTEEFKKATDYTRRLFEKGMDVILERRIIPPQIQLDKAGSVKGERIDWNVRTLVTLGDDPINIFGEIRYANLSGRPVNIHQGAGASFIRDARLDYRTEHKINEIGEKCSKVLAREVNPDGKPIMGFIGVDLIVDEVGEVYVIEVNSGAVGGFGTMTSLLRAPLYSEIAYHFLPACGERMYLNFQERPVSIPEDLTPVPLSSSDKHTLAYVKGRMGDKAGLDRLASGENSPGTLAAISLAYQQVGEPQKAIDYSREAYVRSNDPMYGLNLINVLHKNRCLIEARELTRRLMQGKDSFSEGEVWAYLLTHTRYDRDYQAAEKIIRSALVLEGLADPDKAIVTYKLLAKVAYEGTDLFSAGLYLSSAILNSAFQAIIRKIRVHKN